jgi:hypothetical protein
MTWNEFKAWVDRELLVLGRGGDVPIHYIDISHPRTPVLGIDEIIVGIDPKLGLCIS